MSGKGVYASLDATLRSRQRARAHAGDLQASERRVIDDTAGIVQPPVLHTLSPGEPARDAVQEPALPERFCLRCLPVSGQFVVRATRVCWEEDGTPNPTMWYQCDLPHTEEIVDPARFRQLALAEFFEVVRGGRVAEALAQRGK